MKWIVYIITHGPTIEDYYKNDPLFSSEHFVFFNVKNTPLVVAPKFKVINKSEVGGFIDIGKYYAEAEVVYNVYRTKMYQEYDYIGFFHWDFELKSLIGSIGYEITKSIEECISSGTLDKNAVISFSSIDFIADFNQTILMDESKPNTLTGSGKNCYDTIIPEYNAFCNKNISVETLRGRRINISSAFLCSKKNFENLMAFHAHIIEKGYIDKFDSEHKYRFQGGMMERYVGIFFQDYNLVELPLIHHVPKNYRTRLRWLKYILFEYLLKHFINGRKKLTR